MKIVYGKQLNTEEFALCQQIAVSCGILPDTARLLLYRNVDTVEKAKAFLSPGKKGFHNPFLLSGMQQAVERINKAKAQNQTVLVFGDYDADGICATTVLYYALTDFGVNVVTAIPEREEGYGLNVEKVKALQKEHGISLLITVDCGISEAEKIEEIKLLGIDVVVTDHHEPPEVLPDCIKINPKIENQQYPFNGLCGAGVAYKLAYALIGEKANDYLDFTALATVADSMELIGENRDIVVEGLKAFNSNKLRQQFKALLGDNTRSVTAQTLAYNVSPRINAGGRMGEANLALKLFLTNDQNQIFDYTAKLAEYNLARQVECDNIYKEAKSQISLENAENDEVILVANENWRAGFIGIVAAKLVEDYSRPVIVFAGHDGYFKGSARSVEDVNIYEAINSVKDLLIGFGGHSQAAGISVSKENYPLLKEKLNQLIKTSCGKRDREKKVYAEWNVTGEFSMRFAREIDMLEPFGVGNKRPLFTIDVGSVQSLPLKTGSQHYSFKTETLDMLDFNGAGNVLTLSLPINKKVLFEVNLSTFRNKESLKGYSRSIIAEYGDFSAVKPYLFANQLERLKQSKTQSVTTISRDKILEFNKVGTIFALSNPDVIKEFSELSLLPISLYNTEGKNSGACVVIALESVPEGYKRVVYLDKPLSLVEDDVDIYQIEDGVNFIKNLNLSTERIIFSENFIKLKGQIGKSFKNVTEFCLRFSQEDELYQMIFATTVFLELGIFNVKNGMFLLDSSVKNPLTNSQVYSKICILNS